MRTAIIILILLTPLAAGLEGYCTGQYVEQGDSWQDGLIQEGDVFEYWCELPAPLQANQELAIRLHYPNAEAATALLAPRLIYGSTLVLYP